MTAGDGELASDATVAVRRSAHRSHATPLASEVTPLASEITPRRDAAPLSAGDIFLASAVIVLGAEPGHLAARRGPRTFHCTSLHRRTGKPRRGGGRARV